MNIIICEDNINFSNRELAVVEEFFVENNIDGKVKIFNNYKDTLDYIKNIKEYEKCLYILDIDLSEEQNGIILGKEIREIDDYKGEMVYITAYTHQMSNVFKYKLKILDFIDKGFDLEDDLKKCLIIYKNIHSENIKVKKVLIKDGIKSYYIDLNKIITVETDKASKKLIMKCIDKVLTVRLTLKEFLNIVLEGFIQIHRCCLVNKKHILKFEYINGNLELYLTNGITQTVSKRREKNIKKCIT